MRHGLAGVALLLAAGCATPPPAPPAPPGIIAQSADASLAAIPAGSVSRWLGSFQSGGDTLVISRSAGGLTASRGGALQPLRFVGLGTFADPTGTSYLFVPPDGSGHLVTIDPAGNRREWAR